MNPRHGFLLRCLSLADLYVTMAFHHQKQRFEIARQRYVSRSESNTLYQSMLHEAQNARTLLAFKKIVETGLSQMRLSPSLLPALTPLYLLLQGLLPLEPEMVETLRRKFIDALRSDAFIARRFEETLTRLLCEEYVASGAFEMQSVYLARERQSPPAKLKAAGSLFSEFLFNQSPRLAKMIKDDAVLIQKQLGQALIYPHHQYTDEGSAPVSKLQVMSEIIASAKGKLSALRLALVLPWKEDQNGQTCKIHAFHAAAWAMHLLNPLTTPCPPPIHPTPDLPSEKLALVQQAKELFSSQIGEVYSPQYLMQLIQANGYTNIRLYQCKPQTYLAQLKQLIDVGALALVYFDVSLDPKTPERIGQPGESKGSYEHSAVVLGYSTEDAEDYFWAYQWDRYFKLKGEALLASTNQLEPRRGELFYDLAKEGEPYWIEWGRINEFVPELVERVKRKEYRGKLFAPPPPKGFPSFRNCIIAIGPNLEKRQEVSHTKFTFKG